MPEHTAECEGHIRLDVVLYIRPDVKDNIRTDVVPYIRPDVKNDIRPDVFRMCLLTSGRMCLLTFGRMWSSTSVPFRRHSDIPMPVYILFLTFLLLCFCS